MKKFTKRALAMFLTVVLLLGTTPLSGLIGSELPDWLNVSPTFGTEASARTPQPGDYVVYLGGTYLYESVAGGLKNGRYKADASGGWITGSYPYNGTLYLQFQYDGASVPYGWAPETYFVLPSYTVYYNANGGSGAPGSQTKQHDETLWLSGTIPTRSGYTFLGWSPDSGATSASYSAGSAYTSNSDITLYAVWRRNAYTLSYNANGGTGAPSGSSGATSYTISSTVPTRFGYTFLGWSKNSSATSPTYTPGSSISLSQNTTLYAVWEEAETLYVGNIYTTIRSFSIRFANQEKYYKFTPGKSGTYKFYSDGELDVQVNVYDLSGTRLGYDDDSGENRNFDLKIPLTEGTEYYIKVRAYGSHTGSSEICASNRGWFVTYDANGGTGTPEDSSGGYNDHWISSIIPERFGYAFLGWSTDRNATEAMYFPYDTIELSENITLYAVWKEAEEVEVDTEYETNIDIFGQKYWYKFTPTESDVYVFESYGGVGLIGFYIDLYDASGNFIDDDLGNSEGEFKLNAYLTEGTEYYFSVAIMEFAEMIHGSKTFSVTQGARYTLTYRANGGTNAPESESGSTSYTISDTIPERFGYNFLGWSTDENATEATYFPYDEIELTDDTTLYAVWEEAEEIEVDTEYETNIKFAGQEQWCKFTLPEGGRYVFEADSDIDFYVSLFGDSEDYYIEDFESGEDGNVIINLTGSAGREYNLCIRANDSATGSVSFSVIKTVAYVLNYDANGGSRAPNSSWGSGLVLVAGNIPFKLGYTFIGWSTDKNATEAIYFPYDETELTSDTTLYAVWEEAEEIETDTEYETEISFINQERCYKFTPTESDYYVFESYGDSDTFISLLDASGEVIESNDDSGEDCNFKLVIYLSADTEYIIYISGFDFMTGPFSFDVRKTEAYVLNYDVKGGDSTPDDYIGSGLVSISGHIPEKFGYTFLGWSKDSNATEATYLPYDEIELNSDTTLYAVWEEAEEIETDTEYETTISFPYQRWCYKFTPDESGCYAFRAYGDADCWIELCDSGEGLIDFQHNKFNFNLIAYLEKGNEYYIHISGENDTPCSLSFDVTKIVAYTLTYDGKGGEPVPDDDIGNGAYQIPEIIPGKFSYTFLGWSTDSNATEATYFPGGKIEITGDTTLYALWEEATETELDTWYESEFSFYGQRRWRKFIPDESGYYVFGSVGNTDTWIGLYDSSGELIGYNDDDGEEYNFNLVIYLSADTEYYFYVHDYNEFVSSVTFSVKKQKTGYTLTYDVNGGVPEIEDYIGSGFVQISDVKPDKFGYTFLGWSTDSNATEATYFPYEEIELNSDITLYAVWEEAEEMKLNTWYEPEFRFYGHHWCYKFTPSKSDNYIFESVGTIDSWIFIYDDSGEQIGINFDVEEYDFVLEIYLNAGEDYYIYVGTHEHEDYACSTTFSVRYSNPDSTIPTATISSTNNVATSQEVVLGLYDNDCIDGYYWGTDSNPSDEDFQLIETDGDATVTVTVSEEGTYYLIARDKSGNLSEAVSITFCKTTLNPNGGSVSPGYIITQKGKTLEMPSATKEGSAFIGWGTSPDSDAGIKTLTPLGNSTYYAIWNVGKTVRSVYVYEYPLKTVYATGESLDTNGLKLKLVYSDDSTRVVDGGFTTSPFDSSSVGVKTVTVYYDGLSCEFEVIVTNDTYSTKTFSGNVKSFLSEDEDVTIEIIRPGETVACYMTTVYGNNAEYSFEDVETGVYTLTVSKKNHVTRKYRLVVYEDGFNLDLQINPVGDVNGDGTVSVLDYTKVLRHAKKIGQLDGYEFECGDVNSNGIINVTDYAKVLRHVKKVSSLW